ncbi:uncharacterized protein MD21A_iyMicDemo21aOGSv2.0-000275 [Microplitis demolitor]
MSLINPVNVVNILGFTLGVDDFAESEPLTTHERQLRDSLYQLINDIINAATIELIPDETLEFRASYEQFGPDEMTASATESSSSSSSAATIDQEFLPDMPSTSAAAEASTSRSGELVDIDYKRRAVAYWRNFKPGSRSRKKTRSIKSVIEKFKRVKSVSQLHVWMNYLDRGGSRFDKSNRIAEIVLNKFTEKASVNAIIHDMDLQTWAKTANEEVKLDNFRASRSWLFSFKKNSNIVRRKFHKIIVRSHKMILTADHLEQAKLFRELIRDVRLPEVSAPHVYNAAGCTFNSTYSIVLIISATGRLLTPLTIVIDEDKISAQEALEYNQKFENLSVFMSRSSRLSAGTFRQWFEKVYLKSTGLRSCLILNDELATYKESLISLIPRFQKVKIEPIPIGMESMLEPLNEGFKLWNRFIKFINEYIDLNSDYEFDRHSIENIIKIQAFVHNQLMADRYTSFFIGAWDKCGLLNDEDLPLVPIDPVEFAFGTEQRSNNCRNCGNESFVRCSICLKLICLQHTFMLGNLQGIHYHQD